MAEPTFETVIDKRFEDIQKRREDLLARRAEIEEELRAVEDEYRRVKNAQAALQGKWAPTGEPRARKPRAASGPRAPRGARAELRTKIIELLKQHPTGLVSNQIAEKLPESVKQLPNVLSALKSEGLIQQKGRRAPYHLPDTSR